MILGVPKETFPGERRVAMVPAALAPLTKKGMQVLVEREAGLSA
ncbi:MAG: NAD(P)(+) transhydrogenase (Re/Si-specific) subunit alpha, partial [Actinomycetota bacterium]